MSPESQNRLFEGTLPEAEAAKFLGLTISQLRTKRNRGTGPAVTRIGSRVRYYLPALERWQRTQPILERTSRPAASAQGLISDSPAESEVFWVDDEKFADQVAATRRAAELSELRDEVVTVYIKKSFFHKRRQFARVSPEGVVTR
ncbi:helix-turn-helix transcriptional regulator [Schlesneria sp. T3-172]|uniref:helix-turn-helix transcriptional regulator n=1 Tax=Schlesneria sphaerica TaxID=3373610 RepID=UPI0037C5986C